MIVTHSDDFDGSCLFHVVDSMIGTAHLENQFSFLELKEKEKVVFGTPNLSLNSPTTTKEISYFV